MDDDYDDNGQQFLEHQLQQQFEEHEKMTKEKKVLTEMERLERNAKAVIYYQQNKERFKIVRDERMADPEYRKAYNQKMNAYYHNNKKTKVTQVAVAEAEVAE
jgi:hypothetical protein